MNRWLKRFLVFVWAGILYLAGQYLRGVWFEGSILGMCKSASDANGSYCHSPYINDAWALIAAAQIFAIVGVILLAANEAGFRKWFKFSLFFVPVVGYIAFTSGGFSPLGLLNSNSPDPEGHTKLLGLLYILITLLIVFWCWLAVLWRRPKSTTPQQTKS